MKLHENLSWILDRPRQESYQAHEELSKEAYQKWHREWTEDKYQKNIDFVHSLGLKCDCVGWSSLDLTRPDADEILDRIEAFCKEGGWLARGGCSHWYETAESEWYELRLPEVADTDNHLDARFENGKRRDVYAIRAYKNKGQPLLTGFYKGNPLLASEKFREVCLNHQIPDIEFCWARDVGRYASEQYFFLYSKQRIRRIACDCGLVYSDRYIPYGLSGELRRQETLYAPHGPGSEIYRRLEQIGGKLPRIAEIFYDMHFYLQDHYPANEMPESGFAFVDGMASPYCTRSTALIHRDTAELLIREKVLSRKNLRPAPLYREVPAGYVEAEMDRPVLVPERQHFEEMQAEYEAFIKVPRPVRKTTPKEAVSLLRKAKTARKADFGKRMKKELNAQLADTVYAPLAPYYMVADGGDLSDEYRLVSYGEVEAETAEFAANMAKEELLEAAVEGIVFACCPDGDKVILRPDGTVARMSHEVPEVLEEWPVLAQFFADCIEMEA